MRNHQKGLIAITALIILGLLIVVGGAYYYHERNSGTVANTSAISPNNDSGGSVKINDYSNADTKVTNNTVANTNSATTAVSNNPNANANAAKTSTNADWKLFNDVTYGFSFKYPSDWSFASDPNYPNTDQITSFVTSNNQRIELTVNITQDGSKVSNPNCSSIKPYGYKVYANQTIAVSGDSAKYYSELIPANHGYSIMEADVCVNKTPPLLVTVSITGDSALAKSYTEDEAVIILDQIVKSLTLSR